MRATEVVPVSESSQVSAARFAAHALAGAAGFAPDDVHRIGLVATELATNLVKHTPDGGMILLRPVDVGPSVDLEITAIDQGPGISSPSDALRDGYSTTGTLGGGLGAVRRMTDECDLYSAPGKGTAITVRVRRDPLTPHAEAMRVGGVSVAARGERICGDTWDAGASHADARLVLADGLGHGPDAAKASRLAVQVLTESRDRSGVEAMQAAHTALRLTRGAAAAVADIDVAAATVRFVGVGNISLAVIDGNGVRHAVSHGGTLGHEARAFRQYTYPWTGEAVAVMFSDGLTSHWSLDAYPGLRTCSPAVIAAVLFRDFARGRDDVTVVVAKEAS